MKKPSSRCDIRITKTARMLEKEHTSLYVYCKDRYTEEAIRRYLNDVGKVFVDDAWQITVREIEHPINMLIIPKTFIDQINHFESELGLRYSVYVYDKKFNLFRICKNEFVKKSQKHVIEILNVLGKIANVPGKPKKKLKAIKKVLDKIPKSKI